MIIDYNKALDDGRFLFLQSEWHKDFDSNCLYSYLVLPCKKNAIRLYYRNKRPIGLVTWCWFTPEKAKDFVNFEYMPVETDYEKREGTELWGLDFITPYGDARKVFSAIKEEYKNIYGEETQVKWRRAKDPLTVHERKLC